MTDISKNAELQQSCITAVISRLLFKYVDWERMWYNPKCKFKKGDKVKLNWKAKVMGYKQQESMTFLKIDKDGVVDTKEKESWNIYWLCRD